MTDATKKPIHVSTGKLVDLSLTGGKLAAVTFLPPGMGSLVETSLTISGGIIKGLSAQSVESSTSSTNRLLKRSVNKS